MPVDDVRKAVQSAMNSQMKRPGPMTATRRQIAPHAAAPQLQAAPERMAAAEAVPERVEPVAPVPNRAPLADRSPPTAANADIVVQSSPRSAHIPANAEILVQSSPKDMGTVVILGSKK
jgi:hypothetical protein